MDLHQSKILV